MSKSVHSACTNVDIKLRPLSETNATSLVSCVFVGIASNHLEKLSVLLGYVYILDLRS